MADLIPVSN